MSTHIPPELKALLKRHRADTSSSKATAQHLHARAAQQAHAYLRMLQIRIDIHSEDDRRKCNESVARMLHYVEQVNKQKVDAGAAHED